MLWVMIALALSGGVLLLAAPFLARRLVGANSDSTAAKRIIQAVALALLVGALFARPYNPDTAAVPPGPNQPPQSDR